RVVGAQVQGAVAAVTTTGAVGEALAVASVATIAGTSGEIDAGRLVAPGRDRTRSFAADDRPRSVRPATTIAADRIAAATTIAGGRLHEDPVRSGARGHDAPDRLDLSVDIAAPLTRAAGGSRAETAR